MQTLRVACVLALVSSVNSIQCYAASGTPSQDKLPSGANKVSCDGCDFCVIASYNSNDTASRPPKYIQQKFWDCGCNQPSNAFNHNTTCTKNGGTGKGGSIPGLQWDNLVICCDKDYCNKGGSTILNILSFILVIGLGTHRIFI